MMWSSAFPNLMTRIQLRFCLDLLEKMVGYKKLLNFNASDVVSDKIGSLLVNRKEKKSQPR